MTVRQLLSSMDSLEISEWMAWFSLESKMRKGDKTMTLEDQFKSALRGRKRVRKK